MRLRSLVFMCAVVELVSGCKQRSDIYCDETHACPLAELPFCDLGGVYPESEGIKNTCISACTPGEPLRCDGQNLLVCGQDGTAENVVICPNACNSSALACDDASLTSLSTSAGVLDPVFQSGVTEYHLDLLLAESAVSFTPTATVSPTATITVDGMTVASGSASSELTFNPGSRDVQIQVVEGTASTTYTIHVHRGVDALSALLPANGSLSPAFDPATTSYTTDVLLATDSMTLTPTALIPGRASITVDSPTTGSETVSSGSASSPFPLLFGENAVSVTVTPATGGLQTYAVNLRRGSDALAAIELSYDGGMLPNRLVPLFDPAAKTYTVDVGLWVQRVQVAVTPMVTGSSVTVEGGPAVAAQPSQPIDLNLGLKSIPIVVTSPDGAASATYNLEITRASSVLWRVYGKASNAEDSDEFGSSIALWGDTLVVGAVGEASAATGVAGNQVDNSASKSGAVYVFTRSGGVWSQQAYLKASNTGTFDGFGESVALWDDTLVVGAHRERSAATGVNGDQSDNSAGSSGAAYVFTRSGGVWSQQAYLKASNTGASDNFGKSVSLWDNTLIVGAPAEDSGAAGVGGNGLDNSAPQSGAAYVFVRNGGTWGQEAYLKASNPNSGDNFGTSVSVWRDTVVVGAFGEASAATGVGSTQSDNSALNSGAVYVFSRNGGQWAQQEYLKASNTDAGDLFGTSVAVWGDTVAVGAPYEASAATGVGGNQSDNTADRSGAVYVFARKGGTWSQEAYIKASNADQYDQFGSQVELWADSLAVGAHGEASSAIVVGGDETANTAGNSGAVYVLVRNAGVWSSQYTYIKASNTDAGDWFGTSIGLWGDTLVVGSRYEASSAAGVLGSGGLAQNDNSGSWVGAIYIYR